MSRSRVLAWAALAALLAFSAWGWPRLPSEVPRHFGLDGMPDDWGPRTFWSWFGLPAVAAATGLLMEGLGAWMSRRPALVNLPGGVTLDELPPGEREPVLRVIRSLLALVHLELVVVLALVQAAIWRAAHGAPSGPLLLAALLVAFLSSPFFTALVFLRLQRALERARAGARNARVEPR